MKEKDVNKLKWYNKVEWSCYIFLTIVIGLLIYIPTLVLSWFINNFFLSLLIVIIAYIVLCVLADIDSY